jgi:hypothetical protein
MVEGFEKGDLIIDEKFADGFGVELVIDNFNADLSQLLVGSFVDSGGETRTDLL